MNNIEINGGFKTAPWYDKCKKEEILIGGIGGIGSYALFFLAKTIPCKYYIFDDDKIETHNLGTQFFKKEELNQYKVEAMTNRCTNFTTANIQPLTRRYEEDSGIRPIVIAAFDNMEARKVLFNNWKNNENRELFIDGRLRANYYELYAVQKGQEEAYEKTLFDNDEVIASPCTFKQTAYFAGLIGARIAHIVVNYLTNKYSEDPICEIPFRIEEIGEPFLTNINYEPIKK